MNTGGPGLRLIDGRFELLRRLGGGGMGLVWLARDNVLDREVALKEVRPRDPAMAAADPAGTRQMRERVLREARALARLQHPNVVIIHHIVDGPGHPYPWLVMELVQGGTLADRLAQGPLTVPEAARIGRGVLSALRAAHAAGVQHRDVKPGNVLLRGGGAPGAGGHGEGTPVLTDFGIAAVQDATALTATGALIGSPEYIAPERIRGVEGNPASDLWSLGMMLYVAVEGHHPLRRATTLATLAAVLDEPLPPPVRSGQLGPLLSALLAKDPAARPDAEQIDRQFERLIAEPVDRAGAAPPVPAAHAGGVPPVPAARPGIPAPPGWPPPGGDGPARPPVHPVPPARRRRTLAAVLSATAVALVGALTWSLIPSGGDHDGSGATDAGSTGSTVAGGPPAGRLPTGSAGSHSPAAGGTDTLDPIPPPLPPVAPPSSATDQDLLTPAGVRGTIDAMRPYLKGTTVKELVIYAGYAVADAPTPGNPKLYDTIDYRNGQVIRAPGGTLDAGDTTVDLQDFDWDALPALLDKARKTLNVPHPTMRYLVVGADLFDDKPSLMVYLSDDYGSAYLSADARGRVQRTYPRGS